MAAMDRWTFHLVEKHPGEDAPGLAFLAEAQQRLTEKREGPDPRQREHISMPSSVMAMVCSLCAVRHPVALRSVQPSSSVTSSSVSAMTHGSSASSSPGRSL